MDINDEILNKFIDNELNDSEKEEVLFASEMNPEIKSKLNQLMSIHKSLKNLSVFEPVSNINNLIMEKIFKRTEFYKSQKKFFFLVISAFLFILSIMFLLIIMSMNKESSLNLNLEYSAKYIQFMRNLIAALNSPLLFSICSLGIIGSIYYLYEKGRVKQ